MRSRWVYTSGYTAADRGAHRAIIGLNERRPSTPLQGCRGPDYWTLLLSLWRPAKLITVRFGSAPSSRGRIDDHGVRVGPWAVAIARPHIRGCCGDRRSGRVGRDRSPNIRRRSGRIGRGSSPDIRRTNSSASNSSSSNRSPCCRTAVFAPMHSSANPSNACCRKGPSDSGFGRVQREFGRRPIK
jgi:hypothetical protein